MHVYIIRWRASGRLSAVIEAREPDSPDNRYRVLRDYLQARGFNPADEPAHLIEYSPVISMREAFATD